MESICYGSASSFLSAEGEVHPGSAAVLILLAAFVVVVIDVVNAAVIRPSEAH